MILKVHYQQSINIMVKLIIFLVLMLVSIIMYFIAFYHTQAFFTLGACLSFIGSTLLAYSQTKKLNKRHEVHTN